jgi:hypothetical protein
MTKRKYYVEDDEALDERGLVRSGYGADQDGRFFRVVPDGGSVRVPMQFMDGVGHRPGYLLPCEPSAHDELTVHTLDDLRRRADEAREAYKRRLADAYKATVEASANPATLSADRCERSDHGDLSTRSLDDLRASAEAAYRRRNEWLSNAWRTP